MRDWKWMGHSSFWSMLMILLLGENINIIKKNAEAVLDTTAGRLV
jgi:hypothetical protein